MGGGSAASSLSSGISNMPLAGLKLSHSANDRCQMLQNRAISASSCLILDLRQSRNLSGELLLDRGKDVIVTRVHVAMKQIETRRQEQQDNRERGDDRER